MRRAVDRATAELAEARADAAGLGGTFAKTLIAGRRITYWQTQLTEATERLRALQGGRHRLTPKEALGFSRREELGDALTHAAPLV